MTDARTRMITATTRVLAQRGYEAASLSTIIEAADAPRGSVYHHFPGGKDEIVRAAVHLQVQQAATILETLRGRPPAEVIAGFVDMWRTLLAHTDFALGCSLVGLTVSGSSADLQAEAAAAFAVWTDGLATLLVDGGIPAARAADLATTVLASCEGAVVLCRARRTLAPLATVEAFLVDAATPPTSENAIDEGNPRQ
ncbi:TetR/AcrR family transcriptional regulator [Millisia brevis]|uniref:TetR/AcrR family transcriptional regulator n=1 Tax=Millisia brevis TaxID=264148 RepID=UPI00082E1B71|nr:TetR/AcrR family transcriptional regulator [Millisia brevis]